jgi:cobaltochelatase CobS
MLDKILVPCEYPLATTFGLDTKEVDPSITVTGFAVTDPASLTDPEEQRTAAFLRSAVPVADQWYKFRKELIRDLYYWWTTGGDDVLMFWGPTGSGKTSIITEWCARLGVPLFIGKGHRGFEPHEAFGHYILAAGGETVWAPGPVTLAAQYGCPVVINEYDRIQPSRAIVFNDVFTGRPFVLPGKHGEVVTPRPGFRAVITTNTNLVEDTSGNYGTAASHDISVLERFCAVYVPYPDEDTERKLLQDVLEPFSDELFAYWFDQEGIKLATNTGIKEGRAISRSEFITGLIEVARKIRSMSKDGGNNSDAALERTMSTRILRKWAYHSVMHSYAPERLGLSALHLTLKKYLSSLATESTRIALHQAVETVFGVGEKIQ